MKDPAHNTGTQRHECNIVLITHTLAGTIIAHYIVYSYYTPKVTAGYIINPHH